MKELLNELRIPVYHARQHLAKCNANVRHAVTLGRLDSPIGIILEPMSDGSAEIYDVGCQGAVPEWNAKNAPMEVRSGDRVVEVNGRRGTLQEPITIILEREMARNNAIRLTVMKDREMGKRVGAKLISMKQACGKFYGSRRGHWNVLSVGDSVVERIALRMLLGGKAALKLHKVCKTLKVADLPCLEDLANELRFMMVCIPRILSANHPLDIHMDNPDDLETDIFSQI